MRVVDSITYEYLNKIYWENAHFEYNQKCMLLDNLFSFQKQQYIENISQIIYQQVCSLIPQKYQSLIYQDNFIDSPIFNMYADHLLADILLEGWFRDKWNAGKQKLAAGKQKLAQTYNAGKQKLAQTYNAGKEKFKKGVQILQKHGDQLMKKGQELASATGAKLKEFASSSINYIGSKASAGWNKLKEIGSTIWEGLKKLGDVVFGWIKAAWAFIKDGFKMFANLMTGGHCGLSKPQDAINQSNQLAGNCKKSFSFMTGSVDKAQKTGQQQIKDAKLIDETMAQGGNVDQKLKKYTEKLGNKVKAQSQADLSSNGKQAAKKQGKDLQNSIPQKNKKYLKDIQKKSPQSELIKNNDKLLYESDFQTRMKYASKLLKDDIIRLVYRGITPKTLFQAYYNQSFGKYQGDIIIAQSKLSFKTTNGYLICQQTNLKNNQQIIYQSSVPFKGNHLIFQTTQNQYKQFNHIITEQDQIQFKRIIMEEIPWMAISMWAGTILGVVGLLMALTYLICTCIAGIGAVAAPVVDSGAKPGQTATGAMAAKPTLVSKIAGITGKLTGGPIGAVSNVAGGLDTIKGAKETYQATLGDGMDTGMSQEDLARINANMSKYPEDSDPPPPAE